MKRRREILSRTTFYPCWFSTRHLIMYSLGSEKKLLGNRPISLTVFERKPGTITGGRHTPGKVVKARSTQSWQRSSSSPVRIILQWLRNQAVFKFAPSGMAPVSRYCHSSTNSLRARATIPIRCTRLLPFPKRS